MEGITWETHTGPLTSNQEKSRDKVIKRRDKIANLRKEMEAIQSKEIAQGGLTPGQQAQVGQHTWGRKGHDRQTEDRSATPADESTKCLSPCYKRRRFQGRGLHVDGQWLSLVQFLLGVCIFPSSAHAERSDQAGTLLHCPSGAPFDQVPVATPLQALTSRLFDSHLMPCPAVQVARNEARLEELAEELEAMEETLNESIRESLGVRPARAAAGKKRGRPGSDDEEGDR